jgi:hypothetical protein
MPTLLFLAGVALICGALSGFIAELVSKSREKAHNLPGGSFAAGIIVGTAVALSIPGHGSVYQLIGGACGLLGWLLYCCIHPLKKSR